MTSSTRHRTTRFPAMSPALSGSGSTRSTCTWNWRTGGGSLFRCGGSPACTMHPRRSGRSTGSAAVAPSLRLRSVQGSSGTPTSAPSTTKCASGIIWSDCPTANRSGERGQDRSRSLGLLPALGHPQRPGPGRFRILLCSCAPLLLCSVGLLALLVSRLSTWQAYALAGVVILVALLAIAALERAPYERQGR